MPNLSELVARYLVHAQAVRLWCAEALSQRQDRLQRFCELHGSLDVSQCKPYLLTDFIEGHPGWKSTATRKAVANQVNACLNWAVREGRIDTNPFRHVNYAEADPRPCLTDDVLDAILLRANPRFARALRFLRLTGCRLSDLCRMCWPDIDWERGLVTLAVHKSRKKTGKPKVFALVPEAVELLREVARARTRPVSDMAVAIAPSHTALPVPTEPAVGGNVGHDCVFLNNRSRPWNRRTLGQQLRRMKERYAIDVKATLHGLRHMAASEAIRNGASLKAVSLQLGHASQAITEKFYFERSDADLEMMRAAATLGLPKPR